MIWITIKSEGVPMNFLKKNSLPLFGWLVFAVPYKLFFYFFNFWIAKSQLGLDSLKTHGLVYLAFALVAAFSLGFLTFTLSLQLVVFPTLRHKGLINASFKYSLFLEWVSFCILLYLYCLPIQFIKIVANPLHLSEIIVNTIISAWQAVASLWLYRKAVLSYVSA